MEVCDPALGAHAARVAANAEVVAVRLGWDGAERALSAVRAEVTWAEREIVLYGKRIIQPRLVGWAGEVAYRYSGQTLSRAPSRTRSARSPIA